MTEERRTAVLSAIRDTAKAVTPTGTQVILFGSQARGDMTEHSDWDVLILLDKDRVSMSDYDEVAYPLREKGWEIDAMVNPVLFTKKAWLREAASSFYENVTREGIVL